MPTGFQKIFAAIFAAQLPGRMYATWCTSVYSTLALPDHLMTVTGGEQDHRWDNGRASGLRRLRWAALLQLNGSYSLTFMGAMPQTLRLAIAGSVSAAEVSLAHHVRGLCMSSPV